MTSRQGLWMALVGFVIFVLCGIVGINAEFLAPGEPRTSVMLSVLSLAGGFVGFVVLLLGVILATLATLVKGSGK